MKTHLKILMILLSLTMVAHVCRAQNDCFEIGLTEGKKEFIKGEKQLNNKNYAQAIVYFKNAKNIFESTKENCRNANTSTLNEWITKCNNALQKAEKERVEASTPLSVSPSALSFDAAGGMARVTVTSGSSWHTTAESTWCPVTTKSSTSLTVTCRPNTSQERRTDFFLVDNANGKSVRINIEQAGKTISTGLTITDLQFANSDYDGEIISDFGSVLYNTMQYLTPKITYDNIGPGSTITLYFKIIDPDGVLDTGSDSPEGYSYSKEFEMESNVRGSFKKFGGWGTKDGTNYAKTGTYRFEIWHSGKRIYQKSFEIKPSARSNSLQEGKWLTLLNKAMTIASKRYENGDAYKGQLSSDGIWEGLGLYLWESGQFYIGGWDDGDYQSPGGIMMVPAGHYIKHCEDTKYYVGNWENDERTGKGTCYDETGKMIYYGPFVSGKPTEEYPQSYSSKYKFECIPYANDNYYVGETEDGLKHGYGIYLWSNGNMWYGGWLKGSRDGYGILLNNDGTMLVGYWKGDTYSTTDPDN
ncbi:MAG: hypothetical protein LBP56_07075 [Odoribacteraceae bacterium]|jgi:hypothetical protein|nr:hypothetical protein [Odoribacteraceae bacterium]